MPVFEEEINQKHSIKIAHQLSFNLREGKKVYRPIKLNEIVHVLVCVV